VTGKPGRRVGYIRSLQERRKHASTVLGISPEEYARHVDAGEGWCGRCSLWLPASCFYSDNVRGGLQRHCKDCQAARLGGSA
jgi:hypothetical protein